jgi:hypothetical protein
MNRREAALTQRGLAIVAAYTNGDHAGRDTLIEQFIDEYEFQRLADAFIYTALVGVELAATARSVQFRGIYSGPGRSKASGGLRSSPVTKRPMGWSRRTMTLWP